MENLKLFFEINFPLNKNGLEELIYSFELKRFKKGSILLQPGQIEKDLKFINNGIIREYYYKENKEVNINFYEPYEFGSDFVSFYKGTSSRKWQECIQDVELKVLSKDRFNDLLIKYDCGKTIIEESFHRLLQKIEKREFDRLTKDPDYLYKEVLLKKPAWIQNIPQYHIASYLNVTPETLSRIRKRIS